MAVQITPAGTITREQTLLPTRRLLVKSGETVTKGNVCELDATPADGILISPTGATVNKQHFVALQSVTGDGTLDCAVAVRGHFVTVVADGAIVPGEYVKVSAATAGQVQAGGLISTGTAVGVYWGKEGGVYAKGGSGDFLESLTDTENFSQVAAADGDIVEIELL